MPFGIHTHAPKPSQSVAPHGPCAQDWAQQREPEPLTPQVPNAHCMLELHGAPGPLPPTHAPLPSHTVPPWSLQGTPGGAFTSVHT
jgi:hypothetical protein